MKHFIGGTAAGFLSMTFFFATCIQANGKDVKFGDAMLVGLLASPIFGLAAWGLLP